MQEIKQWEISLKIKGKSNNTIINYLSDLNTFIDWLKKDKKINEINLEILQVLKLKDFESYIYYLMEERKNAKSSINRRISALKAFYKYLKKHELIINNITLDLETLSLPEREILFLTLEECQKLINNVGKRNKIRNIAMIMICLNVGLRLAELINLNIEDIKEKSIKIIGKGDKERTVCFNKETIEAIDDWLKIRPKVNNPALFINEQGKRVDRNSVQKMIKNNLKKINREDCSIHKLRHSAATMMIDNEIDSRIVQEILGHVNPNTTAIYTHVSNKLKGMAADSIKLKRNII